MFDRLCSIFSKLLVISVLLLILFGLIIVNLGPYVPGFTQASLDPKCTHYATLRLAPDATAEQIHVSYLRQRAARPHRMPDRQYRHQHDHQHQEPVSSDEHAKGLGEEPDLDLDLALAHLVLTDKISRCAYDVWLGHRARWTCLAIELWALTRWGWEARERDVRSTLLIAREGSGVAIQSVAAVAAAADEHEWVSSGVGPAQPTFIGEGEDEGAAAPWDIWGRRAAMWLIVMALLIWRTLGAGMGTVGRDLVVLLAVIWTAVEAGSLLGFL